MDKGDTNFRDRAAPRRIWEIGLLLAALGPSLASCTRMDTVDVTLDARHVRYTMRGGIGASWHAIAAELPPFRGTDYEVTVRTTAPRGSAVGGNPPLHSEEAWADLFDHADWLGLNWIRVELSQRMYEPEEGVFDWENEEMQALFRILDWCQSRGVDVLLTQMWSAVEWNAFPEVHPLQSAPRSVEAFSEGLATLLEELVTRRGYTCVQWLVITNEPGYDWAWWLGPEGHRHSITPGLRAVRSALDDRNISVPLSGPDWTNPPGPEEADLPQPIDFDTYLGAYDIHSYGKPDDELEATWSEWVLRGRSQGKPVFLSEMGDMSLGWGTADPGPRTFEAALSNTEKVLRGLRAGLDAFNRWSFVNRGDLDGQWQLVRTWDIDQQRYLERVEPEPIAFAGYGILTRAIAKHSDVLDVSVRSPSPEGFFVGALRSPGGVLTMILLNRGDSVIEASVSGAGEAARESGLYRYRLSQKEVDRGHLDLDPVAMTPVSDPMVLALHPRSITVLSGHYLRRGDPGIATD